MILVMGLSVFMIIGLYSMIFSWRRLSRPGVSSEVRQLFLKKQTTYVLLFIIIWSIQLASSYYHLLNPTARADDHSKKLVDYVSGIAMFTTGIILAVVRLCEPLFVFLIKQFTFNCFGILLDEEKEGVQTKTLSTFLASSLNVELVHIILKSVKKFSANRIDDTDSKKIE